MKTHQLVSEDKHSFVIRHPKGHDFTVAKAGLDQNMIAKIKAMPGVQKFADGGEVQPIPLNLNAPKMPADPANMPVPGQVADPGSLPYGTDTYYGTNVVMPQQSVAPSPGDNGTALIPQRSSGTVRFASTAPPTDAVTSSQGATIPGDGAPRTEVATLPPDPMAAYNQAFAQEQTGIQGNVKAQTDLGNQNAAALKNMMQQQQNQAALHQQNLQKLNSDMDQSMRDYMAGKIDPNRVWNTMGTGNKVMAGIGILLSGLGGGGSDANHPNMALGVLNKAIDDDIASQKNELDKKHTLYSMNLQKYRNENDAYAATKLDLLNTAQAQIQMNTAKAQGPLAAAAGQMALSHIAMQKAQIAYDLAGRRAQAQSLGAFGQSGGLPVGGEPFQILADPKYQKKRVIVDGRAYQTNAEDGQDMRNQESLLRPTLQIINELEGMGSWSTMNPNQRARASMLGSALAGNLASYKSATVGSKRISDTEIHQAQDQFGNPTKLSETLTSGAKNQALIKTLIDQAEQSRATNLIGYQALQQAAPSAKPGFAFNGK